jgi:hypothetical protein
VWCPYLLLLACCSWPLPPPLRRRRRAHTLCLSIPWGIDRRLCVMGVFPAPRNVGYLELVDISSYLPGLIRRPGITTWTPCVMYHGEMKVLEAHSEDKEVCPCVCRAV